MKKVWIRAICAFLSLVLLLQIAPTPAFALETDPAELGEVVVQSREETEAESLRSAEILFEETALREEDVKHFRLDNGSYVAVLYDTPVHYLDENEQWQEYNNTLRAVKRGRITIGYRIQNGNSTRIFAASTLSEQILTMEKGEYGLSLSPVPTEDLPVAAEPETTLPTEVTTPETAKESTEAPLATESETALPTEDDNSEEMTELATEVVVTEPEIALSTEPEVPEVSDAAQEPAEETSLAEASEPSEQEAETSEQETKAFEQETEASEPTEETESGKPVSTLNPGTTLRPGTPIVTPITPGIPKNPPAVLQGGSTVGYTRTTGQNDSAGTESKSARILKSAASSAEQIKDPLLAKVQPKKLYSALEYPEVFGSVTLRYENYGNTVKESLVIPAPQERYQYSFRLAMDGLTPAQLEDGSIALSNADGNVVYRIPAPYLIDANKEVSYDAAYALKADGDAWLLTVTAESEWLNDPARAYPVLLDPTIVEVAGSEQDICGAFVQSYSPDWPTNSQGGFYVGNDRQGNGMIRSYFRVNKLITLPDGCEITHAEFALYQFAHTGNGAPLDIGLYGLTAAGGLTATSPTWAWQNWSDNLTWNSVQNYTTHDSTVIDKQTTSPATIGQYVSWDVTKLAYRWYGSETANLGFALIPLNEESAASRSSFHDLNSQNHPYFTVTYRNTVGIEPQYTYQTAGIGRAGTSYISDYSMQNTLVVPLVSSPSNVMPFTLSLIYNSALGGYSFTDDGQTVHTKNFQTMQLGLGWKLSVQETVVKLNQTYLIYNDADGTEHYFYNNGGYYYDEDGLGLRIEVNGSNYTMTDDYGNTKIFTGGYLTETRDAYGNAIYYCYDGIGYSDLNAAWKPSATGPHKITSVVRKNNGAGAETLVVIGYNGSRVSTIVSECDFANESEKEKHRTYLHNTNFNDGSGLFALTGITFPDGNQAQYTYYPETASFQSRYRMESAYDAEANYGMEFSYSYNRDLDHFYEYVMRVNKRVYGVKMHGYKRSHSQAVYRYYGKDGIADTASTPEYLSTDDILTFKILDRYGRTISSYSTDTTEQHILGAGAAEYTANSGTSKQNNRLTASASFGQQGINLLKNSSAENGANDWSGASVSTAVHYYGAASFVLGSSPLCQNVSLVCGKTYTFSAYIHMPSETPDGGVRLTFQDDNGTALESSETLNFSTAGVNQGWTRMSVTYTPQSSGTYRVAVVGSNLTDTVCIDALQLEEEDAASTYNFVENSSFEQGLEHWSLTGAANAAQNPDTFFGSATATLSNVSRNHIEQKVSVNLPGTTTFLVSGWAKADANPGSVPAKADGGDTYFGMYARVCYAEVSWAETHFFPCDPYYEGWQNIQGLLVPLHKDWTITAVIVACAYDSNINTATFDNIALRAEPVQTYRYDSNGNPIAVTDSANGESTYTYSGADLTQYIAPTGAVYSYDYNGKHDIRTAKVDGVTVTYDYDEAGNTTSSELTGDTAACLKSSATITGDKNHTASVTDVNGDTTRYTYDTEFERLTSITNAKGVMTNYTYDTSGRAESVSLSDKSAVLAYTYANGALSRIDRKSFCNGKQRHQYYYFSQNLWGKAESVKVGSRTLASYTYEDANGFGNLKQMRYGNGDFANYTYDEFDRLIRTDYNSGRYITYAYNAEGALAKLTYGYNGEERAAYTFEYDSLGRLIRSKELSGDTLVQRTEQLYDAYNRLSGQNWVIGGTSFSERYTYNNADGSLATMDTATGDTRNYSYDSLKRLSGISVSSGAGKLFQTTIGYANVGGNRSSAQVGSYEVRAADGSLIYGNRYEYDAMGNITAVYEGKYPYRLVAIYSYDKQNQLTGETYYSYGSTMAADSIKQYEYSYDTAGNLLGTEEEYCYNLKKYDYRNPNWADLLTSVNGLEFTYDDLGNPTTYYTGKVDRQGYAENYWMSWENGRQLRYLSLNDQVQIPVIYEYDADGIRNKKTVTDIDHFYVTQNGKVMRETIHRNGDITVMDFVYDESGKPFAMKYSNDGGNSFTTYYYVLNLQGDVVMMLDQDGNVVAEYAYTAWGQLRSVSGRMAFTNPLRYRGYYYDSETGFYYLQSRYYDPSLHRFINADAYASTDITNPIASNMFAYCNNNPVNNYDPDGKTVRPFSVMIADTGCGSIVPDRTEEVKNLLQENYEIAVSWRWDLSGPFDFYESVRDYGVWDYKRKPKGAEWIPNGNTFIVNGKKMTAEQLGNLNYGFSGAAMHFPAPVLRMAGGFVAIKNNGINWSDWWYDFDSKEDYEMIQLGITMNMYVSNYGLSVEEALELLWN